MVRLQLRLQGVGQRLFNAIADTLGISAKETVLDSLALMHFAVSETENGRQIGSYDPVKREFTAYTTSSLESLKVRIKNEQGTVAAVAAAEVRSARG